MKQDILSLDFWQGTVIYGGKVFDGGTLGCDSLNIPSSVIAQLNVLCLSLNLFMATINTGNGNPALLPAARESAKQIAALLEKVKPFSYLDTSSVTDDIERIFSEDYLANANAYYVAVQNGTLAGLTDPRYEKAMVLLRVLPVMAHLGFSLGEYQKTMIAFADKLNKPGCKRTPEGYAELFGSAFPATPNFDDGGTWMSMTNATVQYIPVVRPGCEVSMLVKRMHYVSFVGMFRSDLFEGLCEGHAPKKCPICGRWFLTTNARPTKYCGGYAPGDKLHRTCRQIGNLKGREQRELAADHPLKQIYETRLNTINRYVKRGSLDQKLAEVMKKLAKDKMYQAISNVSYAQEGYAKEMEQDALKAEAEAQLE